MNLFVTQKIRLLSLLIVLGIAFACQNETKSKTIVAKNDTILQLPQDTIKVVGLFNEISKYISGLKIKSKSELFQYTQIKQWKKFAENSDTVWKKFYVKTYDKISEWAKTEIPDINKENKTIFYPFSGPDYLYVGCLLPKAHTYIMIGREPTGLLPEPNKMFLDSNKVFADIDTAIHTSLNLSYFRTDDMKKDLTNQNIKGTLPIILLFLARTNNIIIDVKPVEINKNGEIEHTKNFRNKYIEEKINSGAEISFYDLTNKLYKKLYYLCMDISDPAINKNINCKLYLQNLETDVVTYLKSASFLMHLDNFSIIRNTILKKSKAILQDDSGVPYRFFNKNQWDIKLFGSYTKPFHLFKAYIEYDLVRAYKQANPKPLDFTIGYNEISNLRLSVKKK